MSSFDDNYTIIKSIGNGAFANVFTAIHLKTGIHVAVKMIPKKINNDDGSYMEKLRTEIQVMRLINHPFIASLYEVYETDDYVYIVMDYARNGTLLNAINIYGAFTEEEDAIIFAQLVIAIKYLHTKCKVMHRDIKAENILFDENRNIKLIDFGLSHPNADCAILKTQCGSPPYASPELILGWQYSFASDIWSLGVLLFILVTGTMPFYDENMSNLANKILFAEATYPENLSPNLVDILQRMLTKNPQNRITIDQLIMHPWVAKEVQFINRRIAEFRFDDNYICQQVSSFGLDPNQIEHDLESNVQNSATVTYNMLRRSYMVGHFEHLALIPLNTPLRKITHASYGSLPHLQSKGTSLLSTQVALVKQRRRSRIIRLV